MPRHSTLPVVLLGLLTFAAVTCADDWPQWLGPQREGVWRETGLVTRFPKGGPKELWRIPLGAGYAGPAVVDGKVYVMDREARKKDDKDKAIPGNERVLCLNAADGKLIWKHEYDCPYRVSYSSGPRCTPVVEKGRVYTLGTMGDLCCLDAANGKVIWSKNLVKEYKLKAVPVWGYAASLLLDGDLIYTLAGGKDSAVVALNKDTGKEVWKALTTEEVGYSPPMIYKAGGKRQLIIWLSESLNSLDPATGSVYWTIQYPTDLENLIRPAVNITTVRRMGDMLFLSTFYHGPMAVKLDPDKPKAEVLWRGKSDNPEKPDGLHILMAAPVLKDGHIYGICARGELRCLKADTGKEVWHTLEATGGKKGDCATAFIIPQGDRFVIFNDRGDLILAEMSPKGYKEIDRAHLLDPIEAAYGRDVVWCHPAFANRCVFARNQKEMVCVSLAEK
jgi:outer membrane protein assembly factor BamB